MSKITTLFLLLCPLLESPSAPTPLSMQDCNRNGIEDSVDIAFGSSCDLDANGVPDECDGHLGVYPRFQP